MLLRLFLVIDRDGFDNEILKSRQQQVLVVALYLTLKKNILFREKFCIQLKERIPLYMYFKYVGLTIHKLFNSYVSFISIAL